MKIQLSDHFDYPRLLRFVFPSVVMMVFTSIYSVVDGLFVSNYAGKTPYAALNLIFPVLGIYGAVGFMIGTGGSAIVGRLLGEQKPEKANRCFSMMVEATVVSGVILTLAAILLMRPIAIFLKAEGEMLEYCVLYGNVLSLALVPFMLQNVFQSFLVTAERPKMGLWVTVAAGITNILLDFLFVAVFQWGLAGACRRHRPQPGGGRSCAPPLLPLRQERNFASFLGQAGLGGAVGHLHQWFFGGDEQHLLRRGGHPL